MKPTLALYIGIAVLMSGWLAGCGQPGPLYLPKPPAKRAPAAPAALPSTDPASQQ